MDIILNPGLKAVPHILMEFPTYLIFAPLFVDICYTVTS